MKYKVLIRTTTADIIGIKCKKIEEVNKIIKCLKTRKKIIIIPFKDYKLYLKTKYIESIRYFEDGEK